MTAATNHRAPDQVETRVSDKQAAAAIDWHTDAALSAKTLAWP